MAAASEENLSAVIDVPLGEKHDVTAEAGDVDRESVRKVDDMEYLDYA